MQTATLWTRRVPARRSLTSTCVWVGLCLVVIGCESKRLSPEDFPRREREEVLAPEAPEGMATSDDVPLPKLSPEDKFREAAMLGDLAGVKRIASQGVDVADVDEYKRNAMQMAAFDGHTPVVEWLLSKDVQVDHRDSFGRTALMYACTADNAETVKLLLDHGADVNLVDNEENFSPLMFAAAEGQLEVVELLLKAGADPTKADIDGETAIDFANSNGHAEVAKRLRQ
ncbi:ankyrin repeat domain-containing protein [Rhodopirellula halodulae]|uniref:ankyrin repeat domain-containing protein n=1 Tax=Rhodopirellula halodulae TaxID=2894198 RepID=UPI001E476F9A|nr:ankyrin repeat domain-containing protein [Rhodopirellula sp. JC737]MCC9656900.1 ankyrin repeat domain-containing protein [Rhodopirellula sp. JC737]